MDPRKPLTQFRHDSWRTREELPHQAVQAILQSRDGYLWLGTHGGLVRFDGVRFAAFDGHRTWAFPDSRISCLVEGLDGSMWVGTDGGGLSRGKGGRWTSYTLQEGLAHERIRALVQDPDGSLWIGTFGGGLLRFKDGAFSSLTERDGLEDKHVLSLCPGSENTLWVGTRRGLNRIVAGRIAPHPLEPVLRGTAVLCLYEDREGQLWVGTAGAGLFGIRRDGSKRYSRLEGLPSESIQALCQDREGSLWIGTQGGGLARMVDGRFSVFSSQDGLSDPSVLSITEDREGSLWIGTEDGLNMLSGSLFATHSTREGLSGDNINTICETRDGKIWAGAQNGDLNCLSDGRWTSYSARDGLLGTEIGPLAEDADGSLWIGSYGGLVQYRGGRFIDRTPLLKYRHVSAIGRVGDGVVAATGMRLNRFKGGALVDQFEIPVNLKYVFQVHEDRSGALWLATRAGLARLQGGQWKVLTTRDGLASDVVHAIHEDRSGALWLATRGGVSRYQNDRFVSCTAQEGLFENVVYRLLEDDNGSLWLSSSRGVFRIDKKEFESYAQGKRDSVPSIAYNAGDGMKSVECSGPTQPAAWKSGDGRLWFPTAKGVAVHDPRQSARNGLPPPVVIEGLMVDGKPVSIQDGAELPPGQGNLEFRYTALSLVAPKKVRFRCLLEGYDREWTEAGTRRTANYTRIPPGEYRFRVIAANNDGVWNERGASIRMRLRPHFYQTVWFYALFAGLALAAGCRLYRLHLNRVRAEFAAVMEERNRIAREIHDTMAQGFAGISAQLEAGKQMIFSAPSVAEEHLDQANVLARSCLDDVRHYVWNLRHQGLGREGLASRLSELAQTIAAGVPFRIKVSGTPRRLSETIELSLLRIGQEAIVNSVKHAHAGQIEVELQYEAHQVKLRVQDDGRGFDQDCQETADPVRFGLLGMSERAREVGGRLGVRSSPGKGTSVEVSVPLSV